MNNARNKKALPVAAGQGLGNCLDSQTIHRESILRQLRAVHADNSARSQCARILAAMQRLGSITTVECTRFLDVVHPPRRVMELRERGFNIETTWVRHPTECGRLHRVGLYVLAKGG